MESSEIQIFDFENKQTRIVMVDGEPWFVAKDVAEIRVHTPPTIYHGFVYAVEFGIGIKIGHTNNIVKRVTSFERDIRNYSNRCIGAIVFSQTHTNHLDNERILHKHFKKYRPGKAELFKLTLADFCRDLPHLSFLDESGRLETHAEAFKDLMSSFIAGTLTTRPYRPGAAA